MRRYLLFGAKSAAGGWQDFIRSGATAGDLEDTVKDLGRAISWWHIVDTETGLIVVRCDDTAEGKVTRAAPRRGV